MRLLVRHTACCRANTSIAAAVSRGVVAGAAERIHNPAAERNPAMVFKTSPYYQPDIAAKYYDIKNPAKAKALLQQAGYKGE